MRRASTCLAVLGLVAAFALPAAASAKPTIEVKVHAVKIPGFPGTGNFYGKGADIETEIDIKGTEYGGNPAPLMGVNFWLPKGSKINSKGFKTCPTLKETKEPKSCPHGSTAGPVGKAEGFVEFEHEKVRENVTIESFFTSDGLSFYVEGHHPVSLEFVSSGHWVHPGGGEGFGPELITEVPVITPITGSASASTEKINVKAGAAIKKGKKVMYYGTVPKKGECHGSFKGKVELIFASIPALPAEVPGETASAPYTSPCPKH